MALLNANQVILTLLEYSTGIPSVSPTIISASSSLSMSDFSLIVTDSLDYIVVLSIDQAWTFLKCKSSTG